MEEMKTNTLSKEAETRLIDFFNPIIDPEDRTKILRQVNCILALVVTRQHETLQIGLLNLKTIIIGSMNWRRF